MDTTFMAAGKCRGIDPELFHPGRGDMGTLADAKAVCAECPVAGACLDYAITAGEKFGVWGGTSEKERRRIRRQRLLAGVPRPCRRPGCLNTFAATAEQEVYCSDECRRALKNDKARRQRSVAA